MASIATADKLIRDRNYARAEAELLDYLAAHPQSLLPLLRLRDIYRLTRADAKLAHVNPAIESLMRAADPAGKLPLRPYEGYRCLVVDPIFRGSRLYYTAMIVEAALQHAIGAVDILTRADYESDLYDSYRDRLPPSSLSPTLHVPPELWYGQLPVETCNQIVDVLSQTDRGTRVVFAGLNEIFPFLPQALLSCGRHLPIHVFAYEYNAGSLRSPEKRSLLTQCAGTVDSLTLFLLDESIAPSELELPGVSIRIVPDPVPHRQDSPTLVTARSSASAFLDPQGENAGRRFLAVGRQSARKGLRDIIRSARLIEEEKLPIKYYLSGLIPDDEAELSKQADLLSAVIRRRTQYVNDTEMLSTYNSCDFVLLPYARDFSGSSGVFAHAMAFGKPVISTSHGRIGWRVRHYDLGWTYETGDDQALFTLVKAAAAMTAADYEAYSKRCLSYFVSHSYEATLTALSTAFDSAPGPLKPGPAEPETAEARAIIHKPRPETARSRPFRLPSFSDVKQVCLLDTSVSSRNMGDHIIVDSIRRELRAIMPGAIFVNIPTHEYLGPESLKLLDSSHARIVCGTNLLASHMDEYKQWKIGGLEFSSLRELTLLGCGWWQYQDAPNKYTQLLLDAILSESTIHSVRDGYTLRQLEFLAGRRLLNTTCPTLWQLTPDHLARIPETQAKDVVTTLTDYKADPTTDRLMLDHLSSRYATVFLWIQGTGDYKYLQALLRDMAGNIRLVPPTLEAYDELLTSDLDLDYVGTRLHAGVRALQKGRRALILAVDNRAIEIARDTGLPCIPREEAPSSLDSQIATCSPHSISLPIEAIELWRDQFRSSL